MQKAWMILLAACGGPGGESDSTSDSGACGLVSTHTLRVLARVEDSAGVPVEGATVVLEERAWEPGSKGQGVTGPDGEVALADLTITAVEGCWGTALDYALVATLGDRRVEDNLNASLFNVVSTGGSELDRRDRPLALP